MLNVLAATNYVKVLDVIWKGLMIGVLVSAPMGPTGALCIQRTLYKGRWHGFFTGLGAMLSDVIYATISCLGLGVIIGFIETNEIWLRWVGSIGLGIFGLYTFGYNPVLKMRAQREKPVSYTYDLITGFLLTFSNALIVLLYIGLYAHFNFVDQEYSLWMLAGGIGCIGLGAMIWWFFITWIMSAIKRWVGFNMRDIWIVNRTVGTLIMIISIVGIILLCL
ncbi:MAG: LysE family transporter [Tannerellaceae bacterium]|jgi:threonine/homoserine/homoserine lactone efflux protein|nr:LysE family transporter [Tannerellaceae bacterium]